MRQAVAQAVHHAAHREAFGGPLIDKPLMRNVLADLALESEAATTTGAAAGGRYDAVTASRSGTSGGSRCRWPSTG